MAIVPIQVNNVFIIVSEAPRLDAMIVFLWYRGSIWLTRFNIYSQSGEIIASNMWDEITYPSPNVNGCTTEVWNG